MTQNIYIFYRAYLRRAVCVGHLSLLLIHPPSSWHLLTDIVMAGYIAISGSLQWLSSEDSTVLMTYLKYAALQCGILLFGACSVLLHFVAQVLIEITVFRKWGLTSNFFNNNWLITALDVRKFHFGLCLRVTDYWQVSYPDTQWRTWWGWSKDKFRMI
jgi:hypothetical protein